LFTLDYTEKKALYEQVKDKMKDMILNDILKENDQLPSVRELSMQLTLNPNTIQKAYKDLETEGYIYSVKGKGNFVARVSTINRNEKCTALYRQMKELVRELIFIGETREQITSQMEAFF
jgi:lexA DNA binding domain